MNTPALISIPVGVVVERHKATNPWLDFVWKPVSILEGIPATPPWTRLGPEGPATSFYAGSAAINLFRTETDNYLSNLNSGSPMVWVVLRPVSADPPYEVAAVTVDPAEGEAFTEAGNDVVETVSMPASIASRLEAFVAEHHVERPFFKRQRDRHSVGGQKAPMRKSRHE